MKQSLQFIKIAFLAMAFVPLINTCAYTQWQQLTGLKGEPIFWIRGTSTELYSVSANGVIGSSNNGNSWAVIPDLYLTNSVERVSASGDTIVAYAFPQSYLSVDNGLNWTTITDPVTSSQLTDMIIEDGILYAATAGDYLYVSSNLGVNWVQVTQNFSNTFINTLAAEGATVLAATDDGLYRSNNSGGIFTQVLLPGVPVNRVYISGNYAYAYSSLNGIYKSSDQGATWVPFQPGVPYFSVLDFCLDGNKVFAATFDYLMVSDTGTQNWSYVNFNQDVEFIFTVHKKGNTIFTGTNRGVFNSTNQGTAWTESNDGIIPVGTEALTLLNDTLFVGSNIYGVSEYTSSGWSYSGLGMRNCFDIITRGSDLYTASDFGIYKSTDSGSTWNLLNNMPGNPLIAFCPRVDASDSLVIGAALQDGILRSGDFGVTWTFENTGMNSAQVSCVAISGNNIIAGTYNDGLYLSTDAGLTWSQSGAAGEYIVDLTTIGNNVFAASYSLLGNFISTDNGATWNPGPIDFFEDLSTTGNIVLGSSNGYVMLSLDSGQTFQYQTPAPVGTQIAGSHASATEVFIGTILDGVWKITISEILSLNDELQELLTVNMHPNIFHSESTIFIDEKLASELPELHISDVSGRLIQKIELNQSRTLFSAHQLNAGIYFYSVKSKSGTSKAGKFVIY